MVAGAGIRKGKSMRRISAVTLAIAVGAIVAATAGTNMYQAYCNTHPDWNTYSAGSGAAWGHPDQDWLGECYATMEAAQAEADAHDARFHANRDEYQAEYELLPRPPKKNKAGVKALPMVDCSPL